MIPFKQFKYILGLYIFYSLYYSLFVILACIPIYILLYLVGNIVLNNLLMFLLVFYILYLQKKILSRVIYNKYKHINIQTDINTTGLYIIGIIILLTGFITNTLIEFYIKNMLLSFLCGIVIDYFILNFIFSKIAKINKITT